MTDKLINGTPEVLKTKEIAALQNDGYSKMLNKIFQSRDFSDLTIICGESKFSVHRVIVCSQSEFFASALRNNMKEAKTGIIELHGDELAAVDAMIQFFYDQDYQIKRISNTPQDARLVFDIKVYAIADKYFLDPLKELAQAKFRTRAPIATQDEVLAAAKAISTRQYGNADGLRQTIANLIYTDCAHLLTGWKSDKAHCIETLGLGFELMQAQIESHKTQRYTVYFRCGTSTCKRTWNDLAGPSLSWIRCPNGHSDPPCIERIEPMVEMRV